jgi:hypothetical protein
VPGELLAGLSGGARGAVGDAMSQFAQRPKVVDLFKQSFKPLMSWVLPEKATQSRLLFLKPGSQIRFINMKAIGRCTVDGEELEFADVRVYAKPPAEVAPE